MDRNIYKSNIKMVKYTSLIHAKIFRCSSQLEEERGFSCWLGYHSEVGYYWFRPQRSQLVSEVKLDHRLCLQRISVEEKKHGMCLVIPSLKVATSVSKMNLAFALVIQRPKVHRREARSQTVLSCITDAF